MKSIVAMLVAAAAAGPALAGGPTVVESEPVIVESVAPVAASADWSGFYAGVQLGYADVDSNAGGLDGNGLMSGIHGGYRWDLGSYVVGTEVDFDSPEVDLGGTTGTLDDVARLKLIGGGEFGNSLIYAATGVAYANATVGGASLSDNGWFYGAGVTVALNDRWTLGGELLQHNFNDFDGSGVDLDALTATARVALRF